MNALSQYLTKKNIRQQDFAAEIGTTQAFVSKLVRDRCKPSPEMALHIEKMTDGAVSFRGWYEAPAE